MKTWLGFFGGILVGLLTGMLVMQAAPEHVSPYMQQVMPRTQSVSVKGTVIQKQREADRLLLTLSTSEGVMLATFKEKLDETDLLVGQGYDVTIRIAAYSPFVENPTIERVETNGTKPDPTQPSAPPPASSPPKTGAEPGHK